MTINTVTEPLSTDSHINDARLPDELSRDERIRNALQIARLAPSSHNTQPWLFRIHDGTTIDLYADRTRALPVTDPHDRELTIACGGALYHLYLALRCSGYSVGVELLPRLSDPDLLARVQVEKEWGPTLEEETLFHAIPRRHTNRLPFEDQPVGETLLFALQDAASREGAWLHVFRREHDRDRLADLVARGDEVQFSDNHFRRELAAWIHPNHHHSGDGMPGFAMGWGDLAAHTGPLVIRTFDVGRGRAARDRELARRSPVLAVLGTEHDDPLSWIKAGQALNRVLLRARASDLWASFLNQPVEVPELRTALQDLIPRRGAPQLVLRLGYGPEPSPTPRRPLNNMLLRS